MRYALLAALLAAAAPAMAQTGPGDIRYQSVEELKKTAADLEETVKQQPGNVELYIKLGFTYTRLEKADEAQKAFENAARLDPTKAITHYMLGLIYEKKGLKEKARAAWKTCLETAAEPHLRETARKHLHHLSANQ
ncbi:MAG: hypothetical protein A2270_02105 [Elusimicrobia bacterium RIFOXYA12_FULL_51_18]|nr:MAG: hypothetical protein A2270_02105 [Elusimicrobia bacterium RIFOXYA12_FULL_51_18]OGS32530.1 MAG: hypothetical protein A2218_03875 [Elusimicrobia bacterium RIFOXYA2_FULL_53_38]